MTNWPTREINVLEGHQGPVWVVRFNPKGSYCLSGGQDKTVRLWNPHKGTLIQTYKAHSNEVLDLCVAHNSSQFTSVGCDKVAIVWDVETSDIKTKYRGHTQRINTVAYNEESNVLVTGSNDRTVKLWDLRLLFLPLKQISQIKQNISKSTKKYSSRSKEAIQSMEEAKDSITSVLVRGHEIFSASVDGCVRSYDVRMGKLRTDHIHHPITSLNISHDGNCVLLGCLDSALRLLDKDSGELLNSFLFYFIFSFYLFT